MLKTMKTRLRALEMTNHGDLFPVIEVVFVAPGAEQRDPTAFRDGNGGRWVREGNEPLEAFRARARAGARANASPRCGAALIPCDYIDEV